MARNIRAFGLLALLGATGCGVTPDGGRWWIEHEGLGHDWPDHKQSRIDPRIDQDCLANQLTPYVERLGAGQDSAHRPTGMVLVSASSQVLYSRAFGASDWELDRPITVHTSFRVGSITKGFTAVAVLQLVEAGRISLEDTIGKHLPEYPKEGASITLDQLLSHTAGLPNYTENEGLMARMNQAISVNELLAAFWDKPLEFVPGTQFKYTNSGYVVLGAIIERVTGLTYAGYMQQEVFAPAGLRRTTVGDAEGLPDRAVGHTSNESGDRIPAQAFDMSLAYSAGGVRSTAFDLVRWDSALRSDLLLGAESRRQLTTPGPSGYGYGWYISTQGGFEVVRHAGDIIGFGGDFVRVPELELAVVVLLNTDTLDAENISNAALRCALGEDIFPNRHVGWERSMNE